MVPDGERPAGIVEDEEVDRLKDLASDAPVIRLVQRLIDQAVLSRASDIQLESSEEALHVRLRLDGMLREVERLADTLDRGSLPDLAELIADWLDTLFNGWKGSAPPVTPDSEAPPDDDGVDPDALIDLIKMQMLQEEIMGIGEPPPPPDPCEVDPEQCAAA